MYDLFSKKIILWVVFSVMFSLTAEGQVSARDNYNYLDFQKKPYYFGLTLGMNRTGYRLNQSSFFINNDSIRVTEGAAGGGFNLHMIANLKLGQYFDFRFIPGFAFSSRSFEFTPVFEQSPVAINRIESVFFELPFHVRFKSAPYKDKRVFVVTGLKYTYDVQSNSNSKKGENLIRISPHDFQYEIGLGMQFFFPYFIFSPEIKFSRGLGNILIYNDNLNQSRVLEDVVTQIFTVSFHFEG